MAAESSRDPSSDRAVMTIAARVWGTSGGQMTSESSATAVPRSLSSRRGSLR
jgi:hypothetical protein